jgi:rubrerythrin
MVRNHDRRGTLGGAALSAIAAASAAGCYWPVPSCDEAVTEKDATFAFDDLVLSPNGFVIEGRDAYASCTEFCAAQPGVRRVLSCSGPEVRAFAGTGRSVWAIACTSSVLQCENPEILTIGSGRRPEGLARLAPGSLRSAPPTGAWFAEMARLEAASVAAFERLARELDAHGAPASLVRRAHRSARDEVRHARAMRTLARSFGAEPLPPDAAPLSVRSLEEVAIENAVEGCVHETLGAALADYQWRAAEHPRVRKYLRAIARDEARHAALAWDVYGWTLERLDPARRARVRKALRVAADGVSSRTVAGASESLRTQAGLPDHPRAAAIVGSLRRTLWRSRRSGRR